MSRLSQFLAGLNPQQRAKLESRFWSKVDRRGPDDCWPWTAAVGPNGYGQFNVGPVVSRSHIVAVVLSGRDPADLCVCHSCDVRYPVSSREYRKCCNPAHLWFGTRAENSADCVQKQRTPAGVRHWNNKLSPEDIDAMRQAYLAGGRSQADIAANFNVTGSCLCELLASDRPAEGAWHRERAAKGERHGMAKLTEDQVREILTLRHRAGRKPLAARFGVTPALIGMIWRRVIWRHVV